MSTLRTTIGGTVLFAFAGPAIAQDAIEEICATGAEEPGLVWYSSQDPTRNDAAIAAFNEEHPDIDVEGLRLSTGQLAARYAAERAAGVINADLISLADPNFIRQGFEDGWFVQFEKSEMPALADLDDRWFNQGSATTSISLLGISYNTERVGEPPQGWEDLLKPEYKGQMILGDPRNVPSYMALFRILRESLGDDYLEKLAAQEPVVVPSVVPASQQAAAGEVAIVVPNVMTVVRPLSEKGAPIGFVAPALTTGNEFETILSTEADSPNAARCFYNFLFTEAGQIAYNGPNSVSPFGAIGESGPLPDNYILPRITELPEHSEAILGALGLE